MWIVCWADDSLEMSSRIYSEQYPKKIKMASDAVVITHPDQPAYPRSLINASLYAYRITLEYIDSEVSEVFD